MAHFELVTHLTFFVILGVLPFIVMTFFFRAPETRFKWWWVLLVIPGWYLTWIALTIAFVWLSFYGAALAFNGAYYLSLLALSKVMRLRVPLAVIVGSFAIYLFPFGFFIYKAIAAIAAHIA